MNKFFQLVLLVVLASAAILFIPRTTEPPPVYVTNFFECQLAGGTITDGEPVTCTTSNGQVFAEEEAPQPEVIVDTPKPGELVTSPLRVKGRARGFWFFEANLPVTLKDQNGKILVRKGFQAIGEWMTEDYVEFDETLIFNIPDTQFGVLIIEKDNPSGLPEFDSAFPVPLMFQ